MKAAELLETSPGGRLEQGDAFANGILGQLRDGMKIQLVHDLFAVCFHRLNVQLQSCRDIFCRFSFRDQL
jgi:hypothetical protein